MLRSPGVGLRQNRPKSGPKSRRTIGSAPETVNRNVGSAAPLIAAIRLIARSGFRASLIVA